MLIYVYLGLQIIAFFVFGFDKLRAIQGRWRVSERTLILLGLFLPVGALLGMLLFRHKIRKPKFYILVPLFLLIHGIIYYFYIQ